MTNPPLRETRRAAALLLADCDQALRRSSDSVLTVLLEGQEFAEWNHIPPGDARDPVSGARYYYHAHGADERAPGEHGHFHTFVRSDGTAADEAGAPTHLIGVSLDVYGLPIRLFATNRWVTAEAWRPAAETAALLDRFVIDVARPNWLVNRWLTALVMFYRQEIADLLVARDAAVNTRLGAGIDREALLEDRGLMILAERPLAYADDLLAALPGVGPGVGPGAGAPRWEEG